MRLVELNIPYTMECVIYVQIQIARLVVAQDRATALRVRLDTLLILTPRVLVTLAMLPHLPRTVA